MDNEGIHSLTKAITGLRISIKQQTKAFTEWNKALVQMNEMAKSAKDEDTADE